MGCGSSKAAEITKQQPVQAQAIVEPVQERPVRRRNDAKFQIQLAGDWKNYEKQEDTILKKAYLVGHPNCKFHLRGQDYEYNFRTMTQKNLGTGKARQIRPPLGFKAPSAPLLPTGPMTVLTVRPGQAGTTVTIDDPNNKGKTIQVNAPSGAKAGQKMAVPLPEPGKNAADVQQKQKSHSAAKKIALGTAGVATVAGVAVGGVILGDHLTGGSLGAVDMAADAVDAVGDAGAHAAEAAADWAPGAADAAEDWAGAAFEDAGDWLGEAADDTGDFVMSLF
jgi:hypothetical protein